MNKLLNGSMESDYGVTLPPTWRAESKAWAVRVALPQAEIDDIEARLATFRRKCADHRRGVFAVGVFTVGEAAA